MKKNLVMVLANVLGTIGVMAQTSSSLQPGDIHPNAKFIDAEWMHPFSDGAAIIRKGNATALIDSKGNIIVPYTQYDFQIPCFNKSNLVNDCVSGKYGTGLFIARKKDGFLVALTSSGKTIQEPGASCEGLSADGKYAVFHKNGKYVYINKAGKKFIVDYKLEKLYENIGIANINPYNAAKQIYLSTRIPTYINLENKIITSKKYVEAEGFSNGMALVSEVNEFGEIKYGFINTKGDEIIPCKFSKKPTPFNSGLARVEPADQTQFDYAYIDKKGKIVLTFNQQDISKYGRFQGFASGYAFAEKAFMDSTGKITLYSDFFGRHGLLSNKQTSLVNFVSEDKTGWYQDGKLRYERKLLARSNDEDYNYLSGYLDVATGKHVNFSFRYQQGRLVFDNTSKLAYAERYSGKNSRGERIWRKGYINENGIFMIVMGEASKW